MNTDVGITAIGMAIPSLALDIRDLAEINNVDPEKYCEGLGIRRMGLCSENENTTILAIDAATNAITAWGKDVNEIGFVAIGTETGNDYSKPLTQAICEKLGLKGDIRSYEVKHACLGATLAIRQAVEWILSGTAEGKNALVVAADVCKYAPHSESEATQGAGAIAFVIGEPLIAKILLNTYSYSWPVDDFYRPIGKPFPTINSSLSHRSYLKAALAVFKRWNAHDSGEQFDELAAMTFHCPFPKMVKKTACQVMTHLGLQKDEAINVYFEKVAEHLSWNRDIGNSYTASLWFGVAHALASVKGLISAFSYGSGSGAELLFLQAQTAVTPYWFDSFERKLKNVTVISKNEYISLKQYDT